MFMVLQQPMVLIYQTQGQRCGDPEIAKPLTIIR